VDLKRLIAEEIQQGRIKVVDAQSRIINLFKDLLPDRKDEVLKSLEAENPTQSFYMTFSTSTLSTALEELGEADLCDILRVRGEVFGYITDPEVLSFMLDHGLHDSIKRMARDRYIDIFVDDDSKYLVKHSRFLVDSGIFPDNIRYIACKPLVKWVNSDEYLESAMKAAPERYFKAIPADDHSVVTGQVRRDLSRLLNLDPEYLRHYFSEFSPSYWLSSELARFVVALSEDQVKFLVDDPRIKPHRKQWLIINPYLDEDGMAKCLKAYVSVKGDIHFGGRRVQIKDDVLRSLTPKAVVKLIYKAISPTEINGLRFSPEAALERAAPVLVGQPERLADIKERLDIMALVNQKGETLKDRLGAWLSRQAERDESDVIGEIVRDSRLTDTQKTLLLTAYVTDINGTFLSRTIKEIEEKYKELGRKM